MDVPMGDAYEVKGFHCFLSVSVCVREDVSQVKERMAPQRRCIQ